MIAEILVKVSFLKHTLIKSDAGIVEGDYNTTKLVFSFDEDVSGKRIVFKMSNPAGELIFLEDLDDNEVLLVGRDADGYTCSLFPTYGLYPFELVLWGEDSKLTSAPGWLNVSKSQVSIIDSVTTNYLPLFDRLIEDLGETTLFLRFSEYPDGTDFTDTCEEGCKYIGIAAGREAPTDKTDYQWTEYGENIVAAKEKAIAEIEATTSDGVDRIANMGGAAVSDTEPEEETVDIWVKPSPEGDELALLDSSDIVQELSNATNKVPSVALLNTTVGDTLKAEKLAYYGDANIEISNEYLFIFTELGDGTYSIGAHNVWELSGHIVLPYKYKGKLVTEITKAGFASWDDNNPVTAMTGLTIPRTVRKINNMAFARNNIPEVIIPGSCKFIGETAFYRSGMTKLVLEEGVEEIRANAFTACNKVTQCVIPTTIKHLWGNSFAGAGQVKDVYYGGSQYDFENKGIYLEWGLDTTHTLKKILRDWIWQANVYYNYGNDAEVSKVSKAVEANALAIEAIKTAVSKGMTIKETILYSGDKFYIHPNSFYIAMPPSKNLSIYYGDGRSNDPYEDEAGIVVGVNSAVNSNDGKFRSATIIQTAGSILSSGGTAIYAYFYDNADEINGETGAYLQWNGASDTYCPVLHSVPVEIEE